MGETIVLNDDKTPVGTALTGPGRAEAMDYLPQSPLVSFVITHRDYTAHVEGAIRSILDQDYPRLECVVVDDCSSEGEKAKLKSIVDGIQSDRVRVVWLEENVGQVPSFFAGVDATTGEFVCLLDPDDRYDPSFAKEAVAAHLNEVVFCPIVSTNQLLFNDRGLITGTITGHNRKYLTQQDGVVQIPNVVPHRVIFTSAETRGWHWSSTSGMMFRRAALHYLRPHRKLTYMRAADAYLANGAHFLGGTLFLTKPLVYRAVHDSNAWLANRIFAIRQNKAKTDALFLTPQCIDDVKEAIIANGGLDHLPAVHRPGFEPEDMKKPKTLRQGFRRALRRSLNWMTGAERKKPAPNRSR